MEQKRASVFWGGWGWLGIWSIAGLLLGCQTPCRDLSLKMCQEMRSLPRACRYLREAAENGAASRRQCRALLATWRTYGRLQVARAQKELQHYETWLFERKDIQSSLKELERAEMTLARHLAGIFQPGAMLRAHLRRKQRKRARLSFRERPKPPRPEPPKTVRRDPPPKEVPKVPPKEAPKAPPKR